MPLPGTHTAAPLRKLMLPEKKAPEHTPHHQVCHKCPKHENTHCIPSTGALLSLARLEISSQEQPCRKKLGRGRRGGTEGNW